MDGDFQIFLPYSIFWRARIGFFVHVSATKSSSDSRQLTSTEPTSEFWIDFVTQTTSQDFE